MARLTAKDHLSAAPAAVRRAMLDPEVTLAPGAAAVVGRFFQALKDFDDPFDSPSAQVFTVAAKSETTLATLLRSLGTYAPMVSTAAGRELRRAYYAQRPGNAVAPSRSKPATPSSPPSAAPSTWPLEWQLMYLGLKSSPGLKPSSLKRHYASIDRCASILADTDADGTLTFYTAYCLAERFRELGIKHWTIAGYLGGLISLGKHGGAQAAELNGVRMLVKYHLELADMEEKEKVARIEALMEKGGFEFIANTTGELRDRLAEMPGHVAQAHVLRQQIALLALHMNKPARTGDVSGWRLGKELIRQADGTWELEWLQEKNGAETAAGRLWHEVSEILDLLILEGRPDRFVNLRYHELQGKNWLTLKDENPDRKLPSQRIKETIGVPSHDLRTLAAEYLRSSDPRRAPDIIQTHLGHQTLKAGESYRISCESDAAARDWLDIKREIAMGKLEK
jgi:hypothetical protein